jgi:serine/threonine protein phosphatase 1
MVRGKMRTGGEVIEDNVAVPVTFVVGDVHGRADLLDALLGRISRDSPSYRVIFLGDLINRGPDSRCVLRAVRRELERCAASMLILGNHEELLLDFLDDPADGDSFEQWINAKGEVTLASFGIDPVEDRTVIAERLLRFPEVQMLTGRPSLYQSGRFIFVHAGIRPGVPIDCQSGHDLRWIREPFLSCSEPFGKIVVHGHTPTCSGNPEVHGNRINIDTGAVVTGRLCAMQISPDGSPLRFLIASVASDGENAGGSSLDIIAVDEALQS